MVTMKDALKLMLKENEFEKIIKAAKGREKSNAKEFYDAIKDFGDEEFNKVPEIVFIKACKSWNVWQDIYVFMEFLEHDKQSTKEA